MQQQSYGSQPAAQGNTFQGQPGQGYGQINQGFSQMNQGFGNSQPGVMELTSQMSNMNMGTQTPQDNGFQGSQSQGSQNQGFQGFLGQLSDAREVELRKQVDALKVEVEELKRWKTQFLTTVNVGKPLLL